MSGAAFLELCARAARLDLIVCLERGARREPKRDATGRLVIYPAGRYARRDLVEHRARALIAVDFHEHDGIIPSLDVVALVARDVLKELADNEPEMFDPERW